VGGDTGRLNDKLIHITVAVLIAHAGNNPQAALQRVAEIDTAVLAAQIIPALFKIDAELAFVRLLGDDVDDAAMALLP